MSKIIDYINIVLHKVIFLGALYLATIRLTVLCSFLNIINQRRLLLPIGWVYLPLIHRVYRNKMHLVTVKYIFKKRFSLARIIV